MDRLLIGQKLHKKVVDVVSICVAKNLGYILITGSDDEQPYEYVDAAWHYFF